jgi:hypothetical protein
MRFLVDLNVLAKTASPSFPAFLDAFIAHGKISVFCSDFIAWNSSLHESRELMLCTGKIWPSTILLRFIGA